MRYIFIFLFICSSVTNGETQSTTVQAFKFSSQTRDTVIQFPTGDHKQYEKILMHYGMRCKDALVSTPNDRNKGCGEWDYSCNTYITDSTRVDSLKQVSPDYVISQFDQADSVYTYTTQPTYTYYQSVKKDVKRLSGDSRDVEISAQVESLEAPFGSMDSKVSMVLFLGEDYTSELSAGDITALQLVPVQGSVVLENFSIEMQHVSVEDVTEVGDDWVEVYNQDRILDNMDNRCYFHTPFAYDGSSDLALRLRYDEVDGSAEFHGLNTGSTNVQYTAAAYESFVDFGTSGFLASETGLEEIEDEVTISFWHKGSGGLPSNSTVLEAFDQNDNRQMNIHLPWGNSQVYWDCGNDGSGYDRINKPANFSDFSNKWNHWAFTKNATIGEMRIYLNGELWHSGTGMPNKITVDKIRIGRSFSGLPSYAQMSEFRLWDKALSGEEIREWMRTKVTSDHPSYDRLHMYYALDGVDDKARDLSPNGNDAEVKGQVAVLPWQIKDAVMEVNTSEILPAFSLDQGQYEIEVTEIIELDSLQNLPNEVTHYVLDGTDRVEDGTQYLYAADDQPILNEEGDVIGYVPVIPEGEIVPQDLEHYQKSPMVYEIMSFVTPYGIYLDLGEEGESWTFDVTDFGPILKGPKRFFMSQGGEWQEEMDIWFEFIQGEPDRDVLDITQIWPCRQKTNHTLITDDWRYEPRLYSFSPDVTSYVTKTTITGHGQDGEFRARTHYLSLGRFSDEWSVWTECADNPVYPQGGTWIYDRAGWCPGKASDTEIWDVTERMQALSEEERIFDYGLRFVTGSSNYLVNSQLVSYGPINRQLDLAVEDIINPSTKIEHARSNPSCLIPTIRLKNHGEQSITKATIKFGMVGGEELYHEYRGQIDFGKSVDVRLDDVTMWVPEEGGRFYAEIQSVNDETDEYLSNNGLSSIVSPIDLYGSEIVIEYQTNNAPSETEYKVYDQNGSLVFSKTNGLQPIRTYRDTLRNLQGCYSLVITDSDDDGLDFFANSDGKGQFKIRSIGGVNTFIEPDFGKFSRYGFVAVGLTNSEELPDEEQLGLFPNPGNSQVFVSGLGDWDQELELRVVDQMGRAVASLWSMDKYMLSDGNVKSINALPPGVYYLTIMDSERKKTFKLVRIQ